MAEIDTVLERLDEIIESALGEGSRIGYFAAMYRRVTARVKQGIERGDFDDGERMSRFDAVFAEHYFRAHAAYATGQPTSASWRITFDAAASHKPIILQHLLLGMNAHIYLDLGVAAAQTAPGSQYASLEGDFRRINDILLAELDPTQSKVGDLSPWMGILDGVFGRWDEFVSGLALEALRESAWRFGQRLAQLEPAAWGGLLAERDAQVSAVARTILSPGLLARVLLPLVRITEEKDRARIIRALS